VFLGSCIRGLDPAGVFFIFRASSRLGRILLPDHEFAVGVSPHYTSGLLGEHGRVEDPCGKACEDASDEVAI